MVANTLVLLGVVSSLGQPAPDANPAVAAAVKRQALLNSVVIEFKRVDYELAGSRSNSLPAAMKINAPKAIPEKTTTTESVNRFYRLGEKIRYENNHPMWNISGKLIAVPRVAVGGEEHAKVFWMNGIGGDTEPWGRIQGAADRLELSEPVLNPVLFHLVGAHPEICSYPIGSFKATGVRVPIQDSPCEEYAIAYERLKVTVWLDPAKGYIIRRMTHHKREKLSAQLDVDYRKDDAWGWLPQSWTNHDYSNDGDLLRKTSASVTEFRVGEKQKAESFDLQFPAGARVFDARNFKDYVIQNDGSMVELKRGKETGPRIPQPGQPFYLHYKWSLISTLLVLLSAIAFYFIRKRMMKASGA